MALIALASAAAAQPVLGTRLGVDTKGVTSQRSPRVARVPGTSQAHVVWEDSRLGAWSVSHQRIQQGVPVGSVATVSLVASNGKPLGDSTDPAIAVMESGRAFVAWRTLASGVYRVFVAEWAPSTQTWSKPIMLNGDSLTEYVGPPVVCTGPDGAGPGAGETATVAWTQSNGTWDHVLMSRLETDGSWSTPVHVTYDDRSEGRDLWFLDEGHHEGLRIACDERGNLALAYHFQAVAGVRRVHVVRHGDDIPTSPGAPTNTMRDEVDTPLAYGPSATDESAVLDLAVWADSASADERIVLVAWVDYTTFPVGQLRTYGKASSAVGDAGFSTEVCFSGAPNSTCFAGGPPPPPTPLWVDLDLAVGMNGRVHALYAWIDLELNPAVPPPTPCGQPVSVRINAFTPDFVAKTGSWGGSPGNPDVDVELTCDPAACPEVDCPLAAVWAPEAACGIDSAGLGKGDLPVLPECRIASDANGTLAAVWMRSQADPLAYAYLVYSWSETDGATWSVGRPLTTVGGPNGAAGTPGSARAASPDVIAAGSIGLFVWDDRRNWTDPDGVGAGHGAPDVYLAPLALQGGCEASSKGGAP